MMNLRCIFIGLLFAIHSFGQKKAFEVFFDFNQSIPNEKSITELNFWMKSNSKVEIISIEGFCDSIDSNLYNKELAKKRINSVIATFKKNKISIIENIIIKIIGEDFSQSKNQAENRKVLFTYLETIDSKKQDISESKTIEDIENTLEDKIEIERSSLFEKFEKAKEGDRIAIYNIHFKFNSEAIEAISQPLLEELLFIMERNPKLSIKIHGHICCNPNPNDTKLSYRRALKIFNYLKNNGIQQNRLAYNGVGSNYPIYPIPEKDEEERIANRRVEIEIVRK